MEKLNKDNCGFSLVEILVVIAIMSIMAGIVGFGSSLTNGKPAEECARKLTSAISHGRTATMGKYRNTIIIKKEDDGKLTVTEDTLIKIEDDGSPVTSMRKSTVGTSGVKVEYRTLEAPEPDPSTGQPDPYIELTAGNEIRLSYDSGSGAMKPITEGGTDYYTGFRISKAGKIWYVKLETHTGRVTSSKEDT